MGCKELVTYCRHCISLQVCVLLPLHHAVSARQSLLSSDQISCRYRRPNPNLFQRLLTHCTLMQWLVRMRHHSVLPKGNVCSCYFLNCTSVVLVILRNVLTKDKKKIKWNGICFYTYGLLNLPDICPCGQEWRLHFWGGAPVGQLNLYPEPRWEGWLSHSHYVWYRQSSSTVQRKMWTCI